jgi:arylsulfatase A-like enzyme
MAESWNPYDILPTITDKTVEWLEKQSESKPFFAYLAFNSPHYPIVPNEDFHGKSKAGYYGDFVIETDAQVGKVLDALDKAGVADNTIVIFTADNGAETAAFDRLQEFDQGSSGEFRGVKRDTYEGGHRVPFIVRWPSQIEPGAVSDEVVSQVDFAATFAELAGYDLSVDEAIDSYNLLPVLRDEDYEKPLRTATVQNTGPNNYAIRQGDWVLIDASSGASRKEDASYLKYFGLAPFEKSTKGLLFNLKEDPRQSKNLFTENPEKVEAMRALLRSYIDGQRCAPFRG